MIFVIIKYEANAEERNAKVEKSIIKTTTRSIASAYDRFKCGSPLMMRKKFEMKDVWFRRDQPDVELFRTELAFDVQLYVILVILLCGTFYLFCRIVKALEKQRIRRLEKKCCRAK